MTTPSTIAALNRIQVKHTGRFHLPPQTRSVRCPSISMNGCRRLQVYRALSYTKCHHEQIKTTHERYCTYVLLPPVEWDVLQFNCSVYMRAKGPSIFRSKNPGFSLVMPTAAASTCAMQIDPVVTCMIRINTMHAYQYGEKHF